MTDPTANPTDPPVDSTADSSPAGSGPANHHGPEDAPKLPRTIREAAASTADWRAPKGFPWPPVVIVTVFILVFSGLLLWRAFGPTNDGPPTVTDAAFISTANSLCKQVLPDLRPKVLDKETQVKPEETGVQAAKAADDLDRLRQRLAAIPVDPAQRAPVDAWLVHWQKYVDNGRAYANEMKAGQIQKGYKVAEGGQPHQLAMDKFSRANGIGECVLATGQKLPARTGAF